MLDRFKRRFSSTSKRHDASETVITDRHFQKSELLFPSSRPPGAHLVVDDEDLESEAKPDPETSQPLASTIPRLITRTDNSASHLFSLPTELLLQLQPYLNQCTEVSLRQSCSRFFLIYTRPSFYLAGDSRFTFLCHLERDDPSPSRQRVKAVCGHCRDLHARSAFPSSELRKLPEGRDCRQVWLCPHRALGFEKAVHRIRAVETLFRVETLDPCIKCSSSIRNRSVAGRPGTSLYTPESDIDLSDSSIAGDTLLVSKIGILQKSSTQDARAFGSNVNAEIFPTRELAAALSGLNFRICPHIQLGDPYILSRYCRACLSVRMLKPGDRRSHCISSNPTRGRVEKCRGLCHVKGCKTGFMFQTRESLLPDISGRRQIWLILAIYRWLGPLGVGKLNIDGDADAKSQVADHTLRKAREGRMWVDHTVNAAEMVEMRVKWKIWLRDHGRKCMPDWSICQLHPEDCTLR
jgi:hypothetical protein